MGKFSSSSKAVFKTFHAHDITFDMKKAKMVKIKGDEKAHNSAKKASLSMDEIKI